MIPIYLLMILQTSMLSKRAPIVKETTTMAARIARMDNVLGLNMLHHMTLLPGVAAVEAGPGARLLPTNHFSRDFRLKNF